MSLSLNTNIREFCIEGRFLDFVIEDGYKLKGFLIKTVEGEFYVKLAKNLRINFDWKLPKGTWLQVVGTKKFDHKKGTFKFKAERVIAKNSDQEKVASVSPSPLHPQTKPAKTQSILVCQKSDCMKRGGKALCQALESELRKNGLEDKVTIKGTGCMKQCKAGPNLIMPDKTHYTRIQASQVPGLVNKHFGSNNQNRLSDVAKIMTIFAGV
ncbi:(2Fe-2S) ferredoxin domain-containing protein [Richelia sinica]|nr:(2Fe-2S) ferredoxin domain-containing protein [Richelia sinica]MBD2663898.1 (2Fe-2S) ferredoxin domain-containing protein [Richelia sinica FACHB-800]